MWDSRVARDGGASQLQCAARHQPPGAGRRHRLRRDQPPANQPGADDPVTASGVDLGQGGVVRAQLVPRRRPPRPGRLSMQFEHQVLRPPGEDHPQPGLLPASHVCCTAAAAACAARPGQKSVHRPERGLLPRAHVSLSLLPRVCGHSSSFSHSRVLFCHPSSLSRSRSHRSSRRRSSTGGRRCRRSSATGSRRSSSTSSSRAPKARRPTAASASSPTSST